MRKVALVTGGVRGIGRGISLSLKDAGYMVIASYQNNEKAAEELKNTHGIDVMKFDVANYESCEQAIQQIYAKYENIDILINNAGITRDGAFHKMSVDNWNSVINTNLNSVFNVTRLVIEKMRENEFGRVINISSINAQKGQAGQTNYCASKAGVIGFTKALALENSRKGITVNCIAPGYIDTDMVRSVPEEILEKIISMIPVKRLGHVEEVAKMVVFLASKDAEFITGSTLSLNGGQYMA